MAALGGLAQDGLVLVQLAEYLGAFTAKLVRISFERCDESFEGTKTFLGAVPLRRRKALEQVGIAAALLNEECHGVFVSGEKFEQRFDAAVERELFNSTLIARYDAAVYVDVVAGVLALDHDIHRGSHGKECNAGGVVN